MSVTWREETEAIRKAVVKTKRLESYLGPSSDPSKLVLSEASRSIWLRLVETLRTASSNFEDYEFEDLAATVRQYEPELALSFGEL